MMTVMRQALLIHYHEIALKAGNRGFFVGRLKDNLVAALEGLPLDRIAHPDGRIAVWLKDDAPVEPVIARIQRVFGVANYAVAREAGRELEQIADVAWGMLGEQPFESFAVRVKRADKTFPMPSLELERKLGGILLARARDKFGPQVKVNLDAPERTCSVEITSGPVLVAVDKQPGPGGMPSGTAGRLMCLLSGGFDSAVAAWFMMKRGAKVHFTHFHATPERAGESSAPVARELARRLTPWQFGSQLWLVPFEEIQRHIVAKAPSEFRIILYRRMMLRIAERLARRKDCLGLVTGDSLAQVASQTLHNLQTVGEVARLPLYRPLIGFDKEEIMAMARRLGTYEVSSQKFEDCCPLFMPKHPVIFSELDSVARAESALDVDALVQLGLSRASLERLHFKAGEVAVETVVKPGEASSSDASPPPLAGDGA
jgi:thiamine biosynthesis protein ThiI